MQRKTVPALDRIYRMAETDPSGCILSTRALNCQGYARFNGKGLPYFAHEVAYLLGRGEVPQGFVVDHECHNLDPQCQGGPSCKHRRCVNLEHLVARTQRENVLASRHTMPSINKAKTQCVHGHLFDEKNTYFTKRGWRECRECRRVYNRRKDQRKTS